ncbi:MAG: hypothetical protein ACT4O3_09965 [Elusimicrobiota bacterium]
MKKAGLWKCLASAGFLCGLWAAPAAAKVVFTGYTDLRANAQSDSKTTGSDALLTALGLVDRRTETRGFAMDSLGLFAATSFNEQLDFLIDITYKRVGATAEQTRLQYAYLDYHPPSGWEAKAGRVTIPLGYYNRHYFYPFQRYAVTPPLYQSAIIGLPIADHGAVAGKTVDAGPVEFYGAAYLVNGYGPSRTSTATFRTMTLGSSDVLVISNNLRDTNTNDKLAYGGNFRVSLLKGRNIKVGVSSYEGAWSPNRKDDFSMLNAYLSVDAGPLSLLTEGLRTNTDNDAGVAAGFGSKDWKTTGVFVETAYRLMRDEFRETALFAGAEETVAEGKGAGAGTRERLIQYKTGLSWKLNSFVIFKTQLSHLDYRLPFSVGATTGEIGIRQRQVLFNLVLTY